MKRLLRRLAAAVCTLVLCLTPANALSVEQALELLEENYVDKLPAAAYEAETLDELFQAVGDPYTYYMTAPEYGDFTTGVESESSVTGIGAGIEYTAEGIRITSILPGGGAEEAGLKPDDFIISVDGVSCVPAGEAHRDLIVGAEGTNVTLTVRHPDGTVRDYLIERRTVAIHNTTVTFENGVGYIDCNSFGSQTGEYFYDGIEEYGDTADVWVVDLRGNTGGYADAAVNALGSFTGVGPKLYYRLGNGRSFYTLYLWERQTDKPAIVLVDGYSASASEILSGGIRAEAAGIVVGSRTYGKGSAQIVLDKDGYPDLFDGDSLKVTAYRFYCSDGNTTDKIGVLPTIYVPDAYAAAVSELLRTVKPASDDYLQLTLNKHDFYVDLTKARTDAYRSAFAELLAAMPPDATAIYYIGNTALLLDGSGIARQESIGIQNRGFSDLAGSAYASQINTLGVYGILGGDGAGHFFPGRTLTRAELAAMLAQTLNITSRAAGPFSDVPDTAWYAGSVNAAASLGFMGGVGGGRFDPDAPLTQEQLIAVMGRLARFLNFNVDDYALALTDDELERGPLAGLNTWARAEGSVLAGYAGNMLYTAIDEVDPGAPVAREQAAATLFNILKALNILAY